MAVWWQLQLARPDLVSYELLARRVAAEISPLPRRRLQGRVPDWIGKDDDPVGGSGRTVAPHDKHILAGREGTSPRVRRSGEVSDRPTLARFGAVSRVLLRRVEYWSWGQPPGRMDRFGGIINTCERRAKQ